MPAAFFARESPQVAADLIGKVVWRPGFGGGRLTEVEAYLPSDDPASHSACGLTRRNEMMFGPPGTVYVFLSYGIHTLLNFVCDHPGVGSAVLVRSYAPMAAGGTESVRGACGPGVVGRELGVDLGLAGLALGEESGVYVLDDGERPSVVLSTRIGISRGVALPLRYCTKDSEYVSGPARLARRS